MNLLCDFSSKGGFVLSGYAVQPLSEKMDIVSGVGSGI